MNQIAFFFLLLFPGAVSVFIHMQLMPKERKPFPTLMLYMTYCTLLFGFTLVVMYLHAYTSLAEAADRLSFVLKYGIMEGVAALAMPLLVYIMYLIFTLKKDASKEGKEHE